MMGGVKGNKLSNNSTSDGDIAGGDIDKSVNTIVINSSNVSSPLRKKIEQLRSDCMNDPKGSPAASTGSYLKNTFFFSLFLLSLKHSTVRYPRFIVMDNLEDKGLQDDRVQQFHRDIIKHSQETNVRHQIIFTARSEVLTEDIDKSGMCVGKNFDGDRGVYSLEFIRSSTD